MTSDKDFTGKLEQLKAELTNKNAELDKQRSNMKRMKELVSVLLPFMS